MRLKIGDIVSVNFESTPRVGVVLSISDPVPYEGSFVRILTEGNVREFHESLIRDPVPSNFDHTVQ